VTPAGPQPVHLVDASFFVFRAWFSVGIEMTDADGQPVNALYGFGRFLGDLLEEARPEHVAVAFDESLTTSFRNEIYPAYKKNREPAPPELKRQFALCRELCRLLGVAEFGSPTHEADDIIGTIASRLRASGHRAVLVTRDKDLAQLVRDGDHYWDYAGARRFAYCDIAGQFGVAPERMADYLALCGDTVDNIPGVPGIGPKTAAALLTVFASLEEIYAGLERVGALPIRGAAKLAEKLLLHREAAYLARRLTLIACDMPLDVSLDVLRRRKPDLNALGAFYDRQKFGAALRRQAERLANGDVHL
jgi:DNA polymerase I